MKKSSMKIIDHGWNRIKRELKNCGDTCIFAGILDNAYDQGGEPIAVRATANEYGRDHIPERPFMRSSFDPNIDALHKDAKSLTGQVYQGKLSFSQAADKIGEKVVELIKHRIKEIKNPPNAPGTIEQKGSSNPLIDTGAMYEAIAFKKERIK